MEAAKNTYPKEYASLLGGNKKEKIVFEFVIPPVLSGISFATIDLVALPIDETIIGSVHSHPTPNGSASSADKILFGRYPINIILYYPFNENNLVVYNEKSEEMGFEVVE